MVQVITLGKKTGLFITDLFAFKLNSVPGMKNETAEKYHKIATDVEGA